MSIKRSSTTKAYSTFGGNALPDGFFNQGAHSGNIQSYSKLTSEKLRQSSPATDIKVLSTEPSASFLTVSRAAAIYQVGFYLL
jgi:hypothetical protein